jgi:HEPN domain-containing protein
MPPERFIAGSANDWLNRAKGDLALASAPLPDGAFYEDLCFHAQQAAEKALKAVYQKQGWKFRYTHDLEELITGLKNYGLTIPQEVTESVSLTSFASELRYPGFGEQVTETEYEEALGQARTVVNWAEETLGDNAEKEAE